MFFEGRGGRDGMTSTSLLCFFFTGVGFLAWFFPSGLGGSLGSSWSSADVAGGSNIAVDFHFLSGSGGALIGLIGFSDDDDGGRKGIDNCLVSTADVTLISSTSEQVSSLPSFL